MTASHVTASDVDTAIQTIERLSQGLDNAPALTDANLALLYLRHLRRRVEPVTAGTASS